MSCRTVTLSPLSSMYRVGAALPWACANRISRRRALALVGLVALATLAASAGAQTRVTQADLLRRVIDLDRLMTPPDGERTGMFAGGSRPGGNASSEGGRFLRSEPDGWEVLAEMDGPGAITRIWLAKPEGQLRIVLDGATVIDAPLADLFNKALPPFDEPLCYVTPGGGHNCYFPIGYGRGGRVMVRGSTSPNQISYVALPAGTQVEPFRPALSDEAKAVLEQVSRTLREGFSDEQLFGQRAAPPVGDFQKLAKGEKLQIETFAGGGVIRALYVALTDRRLPPEVYALHRCVLRVYLDREPRPRVEAPLIDFFGSGFDVQFYNSLVLGTDKRTSMPGEIGQDIPVAGAETGAPVVGEAVNENRFMYCYFPMPYHDVARVEIENLGNEKIGLMLLARVDRTRPPAEGLRFHAGFRKEDPCAGRDYTIFRGVGAGRLVGCVLNIDCPRAAGWGVGDDRVWIDGEKSPSYFGTGAAQSFGDAGELPAHIYALHGATRVGAYGKNSAYRWHISDCIDFRQSVLFTIDGLPRGPAPDTYYGTMVYWYGEREAGDSFKPLTLADLTVPGLRIPGAVEIEGHVVGAGWGNVLPEKYAGGVEFSGAQAANVATGRPVTILIPSEHDRTVRLKLRVHPRRAFERIDVEDEAGRTAGTVVYRRAAAGLYTVGVFRLRAGDNRVTVRCTPKAMLDCWVLEDLPERPRGPEGEDLEILSAGRATISVEDGVREWSGGAQRVIELESVGDVVKFALPPPKDAGSRRVELVVTCGPAGGRFQALLDDRPLGPTFDTFAEQPRIARVELGAADLDAGAHTLALRAVAPTTQTAALSTQPANRLRLGLDVIELLPTPP